MSLNSPQSDGSRTHLASRPSLRPTIAPSARLLVSQLEFSSRQIINNLMRPYLTILTALRVTGKKTGNAGVEIFITAPVDVNTGYAPPLGARPPRAPQTSVITGSSESVALLARFWLLTAPVTTCLEGVKMTQHLLYIWLFTIVALAATGITVAI